MNAQDFTSSSARAVKLFEEGRRLFTLGDFQEAEKPLQKAINADGDFIEARLLLADVYKAVDKPHLAITVYRDVISINDNSYPEVYHYAGMLYFDAQQYDEAIEHFRAFIGLETGQEEKQEDARFFLACAAFAKNAMANPVRFSPENIGAGVNTENDEYINAVRADGLTLYFTGRQNKNRNIPGGDDFYFSQRGSITDLWQPSRKLGPPINTTGDEGALTISPDGRYLIFAGCQWPDGFGSCDIYVSVLAGNNPGKPVNLGSKVNTGAWESQPSLSSDGRTLYFASARHGGYGKSDIYSAYLLDNGNWSLPVNLGDKLNTSGSEMAPFIHPDGQTMYFSSDRHVGMGGIDLFVTRKDSLGNWSEPMNLGYPLNTPGNEINVVVDASGEHGYISAETLGGYGGFDIFEFELFDEIRPVPATYMKGVISDAKSGDPLEAYFSLINLKTGEETVRSFSDPNTGAFLVCIPVNYEYALNVSREGYLFYSENFSFPDVKSDVEPYLLDIRLEPITEGKLMVLRNIFFDSGEYTLKDESLVELQKLLAFLRTNPEIEIEIGGHTDDVGTEEFNKLLSENRAKSVFTYLVENGIDSERLHFEGYGYAVPVSQNKSEEGRAKNRRTEIKILAAGNN